MQVLGFTTALKMLGGGRNAMTGTRWLGCGMGKALLVSLRPCCMTHEKSR